MPYRDIAKQLCIDIDAEGVISGDKSNVVLNNLSKIKTMLKN